jgi:hypothetical protein
MDFLIVLILACATFAFCSAVFLLKAPREKGPPRLHRCGEGDDCHCFGKNAPQEPFSLLDLIERAKHENGHPCKGCGSDKGEFGREKAGKV